MAIRLSYIPRPPRKDVGIKMLLESKTVYRPTEDEFKALRRYIWTLIDDDELSISGSYKLITNGYGQLKDIIDRDDVSYMAEFLKIVLSDDKVVRT